VFVFNNLTFGNKNRGINIGGKNVQVKNNISTNNGVNFRMTNPPIAVSDHNLFFNTNTGTLVEWANHKSYASLESYRADYPAFEKNSRQANPGFINDASLDFRLVASSPAVDTGVPIALFNWDFENHPRPAGAAWDIGPYEFSPASVPTTQQNPVKTQ
jgi:hypothetical protein